MCQNPAPFPTVAPTSHPLTMALEAETKKVVSQFEVADHDVNAATLEFLRQMGRCPGRSRLAAGNFHV